MQNECLERFRQYKNIDSLNRELVTALIERIYIYEDKRIEIVFKFQGELEKLISYISEGSIRIAV